MANNFEFAPSTLRDPWNFPEQPTVVGESPYFSPYFSSSETDSDDDEPFVFAKSALRDPWDFGLSERVPEEGPEEGYFRKSSRFHAGDRVKVNGRLVELTKVHESAGGKGKVCIEATFPGGSLMGLYSASELVAV